MSVKESIITNISDIAKCHIDAFPSSVSSKLGMPFCKKMMEWFIVNNRGVLYHAEDDNGIVIGYVSMMIKTDPGQSGSFSTISHYAFKAVLISLMLKPWLIFNPLFRLNHKTIKNIVLKKLGFKESKSNVNNSEYNKAYTFKPQIGIVGIGVDPKFQGHGYAGELLRRCALYCKSKGFDTLSLSVHKDNNAALKAYKKMGFEIVSTKEDGDLCMILKI